MSDIRSYFGAASTSKKSTRSPKKTALSDERNNTGSPVKAKTRSEKLNFKSNVVNLADDDSEEDPVPKSLKSSASNQKKAKRNRKRVILDSSEEEYFDDSIVSKAANQNKPKKRSAKLFSSDSDEPSKPKSPIKKKRKIISSSEESTPSPKKRGKKIKEPSPEYMEVDDSEDEPEIVEQEEKKRGRRKRTPPNQKKIDAMLSKKIPANKQLPKNLGKPTEQLKTVDPLTFFGATSAKLKPEPVKVQPSISLVDVATSEDDEPKAKKSKTPVKAEQRKSPRKPLNEIKKTPSPKKSASTTPEKPKEQIDPKKMKKTANVLPEVKKQKTVCVKMECPPMVVAKRAELPWVDKYKPQDLKSLAGQNTDKSPTKKLLHWLKEWSKNNLGVNGLVKKVKPNPFLAQSDGTAFKAALLSGPPGIGKTSAAVICCKELGLKYVEMNASDARNKKLLAEKTAELLGSRQIDEFLLGEKPSEKSATEITHVLIMDEVDGMSGNQDRGGVAEVIQLIKDTKVPIICICNDRMHPKIRSLANHCFDLRFQRPRVEQIKARLLTIMAREKLKIPSEVLNDLMEASNHDIRQCIYSLQLIAAGAHGTIEKKDISVNIFEAARKILSKETNLATKQDMFFSDYSIMPLFVQENYPSVRGENVNIRTHLSALKKAAQCISDADILDKEIRSNGSWNLLPEYGLMSCALPAMYLDGHMTDQITFPLWLGKNSTSNKRQRMMRQLATHAHLKITGNCQAMVTDYVPLLRDRINRPLIKKDVDGVKEVIEVYKHYDLMREDTEAMEELGLWPGMKDIREKVSTKAKSALTRNLNKEVRLLPYSLAAATKGKKKAVAVEEELDEEGHVVEKVVGANSDDEAENDEKDEDLPDIKIKTETDTKTTTSKRGGGTSRGGRGGRGRGASRK